MDRNYIVGLVLIGVVFVAWMFYMGQKQPAPRPAAVSDSVAIAYQESIVDETPPAARPMDHSESTLAQYDSLAAAVDTLPEEVITVNTDLYTAKLTTRGGGLTSFILKKFDYLDNGGIEMVHSDGAAVPNFRFDRGRFELENIHFAASRGDLTLSDLDSDVLAFTCTLPSGVTMKKTYRFYADTYQFDIELEIDGVHSLGAVDFYEMTFLPGLEPTEKNIKDDLSNFRANALLGSDIESFNDFNDNNEIQDDLDGVTDWISTRSKYFTAALIPTSRDGAGLKIEGSKREHDEDRGVVGFSRIGISLKMRLGQRDNLFDAYTVYLGPLDYNTLKVFGNDLENTLDLGWSIIRPFSKGITWLLGKFHNVIPNYGIVIILFTVIIKLVLSPLSFMSMKSMRRMQEIQPLMAEIKERHKKDAQKMNQEVMKLYKENKINPLGGCLPMLPQIPILFALFTVFRSTIEFRGAPFVWWMQDLSQPDSLYILPVLMAVTMFVQQKITVKDPKQKMMVYLFPAVFLWWGISFPTGLVLYWTVFNIFGLFEAVFVHKRHIPVTSPAQTVSVTDAKQTPKRKK
ncbi:MAG: membrane protein insertase YidC [candidate division Zixibacteria bacterium]|nr:membrane protein insertase YidC [candidate division Zixibacteria bacterium]MBU1470161.1 membrane protein insertase YidC [candidate division Zixibacteria bacterium]MBU2625996.1 membrane protein insertase YidC [candidate division Zixibacteria bacterium]